MNNELDSAIRIKINQKLVETGEKEVLKDFLRTKLTSIGWKEQLKSHCKGID